MKNIFLAVIVILTVFPCFAHGQYSCGHYNCHGAMCRSSRGGSFHCSTDNALIQYRAECTNTRKVYRGLWNRWGATTKSMINPYAYCTYEAKKRKTSKR